MGPSADWRAAYPDRIRRARHRDHHRGARRKSFPASRSAGGGKGRGRGSDERAAATRAEGEELHGDAEGDALAGGARRVAGPTRTAHHVGPAVQHDYLIPARVRLQLTAVSVMRASFRS